MRAVGIPVLGLLALKLVTGRWGGDESGEEDAAPFEGQRWILASGVPFSQDVGIVRPSALFEGGTRPGRGRRAPSRRG